MEKTTLYHKRYVAEYSMGMLDYERYHYLLLRLDEIAVSVGSYNIDSIIPYCSLLKELYINLRPIMYNTVREKFEKWFEEIEKEKIKFWQNLNKNKKEFPYRLTKLLEKVHIELLETRQIMGLGIKVLKKRSEEAKLKDILLR